MSNILATVPFTSIAGFIFNPCEKRYQITPRKDQKITSALKKLSSGANTDQLRTFLIRSVDRS